MYRRRLGLIAAVAIASGMIAVVTVLSSCSCSIGGSEGSKGVDVSMGGKVVKADYLRFQPVSMNGTSLVIRNTASERPLEIGTGTPILSGDGSTVVSVRNSVTIDPGKTGTLILSGGLATGLTYYLGKPQGGGKPTIRQLFIAPESSGGGGGGGFSVPDVDDPEIPE